MLSFASFFVELKKYLKKINIPKTCVICGRVNKNSICINCENRIKKFEKHKLISDKNKIKHLLHCDMIYFDKLFYLYDYKGLIRKLILSYKFYNKSYFCNFFVKMLLNCKKTYRFFSFYDIIIPVPMEKEKKLQRGYNQTELITNAICINTKIINGSSYLKKIKRTKMQSSLDLNQRKENIKNAFCVINKNELIGKKIILFDDICTTGNTVNEISRILKGASAGEILVIVLAKD